MKTIRVKYPCGMEVEAKAFSILTLILGWWGLGGDGNDSKLDCPLHGKDCQIPKHKKE